MKTLLVALLLMVNLIGATAQPGKLPGRKDLQQRFLLARFIRPQLEKKGKLLIKNNLQMDSLFMVMQTSWLQYVKDSLNNVAVYNNLDGYSYYWCFSSITQQLSLSKPTLQHLFKQYLLPSLLTDYNTVNASPTADNLKLLWMGSVMNTLNIGSGIELDAETFRFFYQLYNNLNRVQNLFPTAGTAETEEINRIKTLVAPLAPWLQTRLYYVDGQTDKATANYLKQLAADHRAHQDFAKQLIAHYQARGNKEQCYRLLNSLLLQTSNDVLPRDTIYKWFIGIDATEGPARYMETLQNAKKAYLVDGRQNVTLPQKFNLLNNELNDARIKKAKYILLDFWFVGCGPCMAEIGELNALQKQLKDSTDVVFLSVNVDGTHAHQNEAYVRAAIKKLGINFPVVYADADNDLGKQLKVESYPSKFIIDNKGHLITKTDNMPFTAETFLDFIKQQAKP